MKNSLFAAQKYFFDHSKVRFTANPKLVPWAQTLAFRPFRFTKNGPRKNLNSRSELAFPVFQTSQQILMPSGFATWPCGYFGDPCKDTEAYEAVAAG